MRTLQFGVSFFFLFVFIAIAYLNFLAWGAPMTMRWWTQLWTRSEEPPRKKYYMQSWAEYDLDEWLHSEEAERVFDHNTEQWAEMLRIKRRRD